MYESGNTISLKLEQSGVYSVTAYTKQTDRDTKRADSVVTVNYDATTSDIEVVKQLECVTISE